MMKGKYRGRKRSVRSRTVVTAYVAHKTGKHVKRETGIYRITNFREKSGAVKFLMIRLYNLQKNQPRFRNNHSFFLRPKSPPKTCSPSLTRRFTSNYLKILYSYTPSPT
jgi:hypothetical protein